MVLITGNSKEIEDRLPIIEEEMNDSDEEKFTTDNYDEDGHDIGLTGGLRKSIA